MRKSEWTINIPGYRCYKRPHENRRRQTMAEGGTAILVTADILEDRVEVLPHIKEGDSTGTTGICVTTSTGRSMFLFATYSETEGSPITEHLNISTAWKRRTEAIKTSAAGHMDSPVIWCGDFNVHIHDAPDSQGRTRTPLPYVPSHAPTFNPFIFDIQPRKIISVLAKNDSSFQICMPGAYFVCVCVFRSPMSVRLILIAVAAKDSGHP